MTTRLVVCFVHRRRRGSSADFAQRAASLIARAGALGGRVIGWNTSTFCIDFAKDAIEDALELLTEEAPDGERQSSLDDSLSAGVAEGSLEVVAELGGRAALGHGETLERALALAHIARPPEVLLDPSLDAVRSGQVLTRGARLGMREKTRVRGLILDAKRPLRGDASAALSLLRTPERVGGELSLPLELGAVSVIRAPLGAGGSRALSEIVPGAALRLRPVLGEPLGALRVALDGAGISLSELEPDQAATIESVLAAEGLDLESTVNALCGWLSSQGPQPALAIDDIEQIDADSLEVVAAIVARKAAACVARVVDELPGAFEAVRVHATCALELMSATEAPLLAGAFLGGALADRARQRWARRGGGLALAIREALCEALESGELIHTDGAIAPRARIAGRGASQPAAHWVLRRARFLPASARHLLDVLAIVRAPLSHAELQALIGGEHADWLRDLELLERRQWIVRAGNRVALPSASHASGVEAGIDERQRAQIHSLLSRALGASPRPMAAVSAAAHALLAGNVDSALPLARRGAAACRAVGLSETARALVRFTETGDPAAFAARGLLGGASAERAGLQRSDVPPASLAPRSGRRRPLPATEERNSREPAHTTLVGPVGGGPEVAARLSRALKDADVGALDALVAELRDDEDQQPLADRVEAMVRVARGELSDALRLSRKAKLDAVMHGASERARSALAHAVALAAAGRKSDALLEALDGLARAREAADITGERACARFLAKLSRAVGDEQAADAWGALAKD